MTGSRVEAAPAGHLPHLDALRAFAVLAVLASHFVYTTPILQALGPLGVRLFFVLSGFLITGILLRCRHAPQRVGLTMRRFYIRRALRIAPLYYVTLAALLVVGIPPIRADWAWHAGYLSNVLFVVTDSWRGPVPAAHFWSLAVEEQFYLVWPAVILLSSARWLWRVVVAVTVAGALWAVAGVALGWTELATRILPMAAFDALGLGALLALHAADGHLRAPRWLGWAAAAAAPPLALYLLLMLGWANWLPAWAARGIVYTYTQAASVWFGVAVWYAAHGPPGPVGRALAWAPLAYLGRISYGVYLLHNFMPLLVPWALGVVGLAYPASTLARLPLLVGSTVVLAAASWRWLEQPINAQKRRFPYIDRSHAPMTALGVGVGVSASPLPPAR